MVTRNAFLVLQLAGGSLAAAVGITLVAWGVAEYLLTTRSLLIPVATGLAVIALTEYVWARARRGGPPEARHAVARVALLAIETFVAVSAIEGGVALFRGAFDQVVSVGWLSGTPFRDYAVPAQVLVVVVGGSALLAAATVFLYREWALLASALAGFLLVGFLLVEAAILDTRVGAVLPTVLAMQLLYFVPGVAIFGLAALLWKWEYRHQHRRGVAALQT
jgi:hypothetical protein